jgi:hypothetical protein
MGGTHALAGLNNGNILTVEVHVPEVSNLNLLLLVLLLVVVCESRHYHWHWQYSICLIRLEDPLPPCQAGGNFSTTILK